MPSSLVPVQDSNKWGGAIELSILSRHLQREIAAFDISTLRVRPCWAYRSSRLGMLTRLPTA